MEQEKDKLPNENMSKEINGNSLRVNYRGQGAGCPKMCHYDMQIFSELRIITTQKTETLTSLSSNA